VAAVIKRDASGRNAVASRVSGILCKRVLGLGLGHAVAELDGKAVQCRFPIPDRHGPFHTDVA